MIGNHTEFSSKISEAIDEIQRSMKLSEEESLNALDKFHAQWKHKYKSKRIATCIHNLDHIVNETENNDEFKYHMTYLKEALEL